LKKNGFLYALAFILILLMPKAVFADDGLKTIQLKTNFNIWKVDVTRAGWVNEYPKLSWNGIDVKLPKYLPSSLTADTSKYLTNKPVKGIDYAEVKSYLEKIVVPEIKRDKQDVTIKTDDKGKVIFDGFAMSGQDVDFEKAFYLIQKAFATNQPDVRLPIITIQPNVNVESEDLKSKGIVSLLATGETDFTGSPRNRQVNIRVGLSSFNGKLVAPGAESGAGAILGRVDGTTGYLQELVIKGDKTVPEYGGGLCQVSTTVYRSLLFAGVPILERRNHSYAVSYYDPQGLDATIYPPNPDMKFKNDTSAYILLQTTTVGNKAYSNVYGTPVARHVDLIGPYYYDYRGAPPARTEYTDKLPAGEVQKLGAAHPGFKASWYRRISYDDGSQPDALEHIFSNYEARPLYTLIGTGGAETPVVNVTE
jgi:vancomycin resistance protein YoaR